MTPPPLPARPRPRPRWIWGVVAFAVVFLCAAGVAVNDTVYLVTEKPGTVTVSYCAGQTTTRGRRIYDCVGDYVSDDGSLRVAQVHFPETIRLAAGDTERVTVAGPHSTDAHPLGVLHIAIFFTVALAALAAIAILVVRRVRRRP